MNAIPSFANLSDTDLLHRVRHLAVDERHAMASLIASLAEMDARRLYLGEGCSSLFTWCTQVLHLSEHAAYASIEAARAGHRFPLVLERLGAGELTLTGVCLLRPHLTEANYRDLLDAARHRSKREVEHLVAALRPKPDVAAMVRKLPAAGQRSQGSQEDKRAGELLYGNSETRDSGGVLDDLVVSVPSDGGGRAPVARRPVVAPLAPERYKVQFTVGRATHDKLRRAQDLLRHAVPDGDPAEIFDRALTLLVERLEKTKLARAARPRARRPVASASRRIPAAVRRTVWERDGGQCAFVGSAGRCTERAFLEFHHVVPYARGGLASAANIQLRCRAHNEYEAEKEFGPRPTQVREEPAEYVVNSVPDRVHLEHDIRAAGWSCSHSVHGRARSSSWTRTAPTTPLRTARADISGEDASVSSRPCSTACEAWGELLDHGVTSIDWTVRARPGHPRIVATFNAQTRDRLPRYQSLRRQVRVSGTASLNPATGKMEVLAIGSVQPRGTLHVEIERFFTGRTLEELAREQGVAPVNDLPCLLAAGPKIRIRMKRWRRISFWSFSGGKCRQFHQLGK